jgi:hypothetical protein
LNGGTVLLSSLGNISNTGGTFAIGGSGTLDIGGGTLTIGSGTPFQTIDASGGELRNGTVVYQSGSTTLGNLNHITWEGPMNLGGDYVLVGIRNGFTILGLDGVSPGVINLTGITGQVFFADAETLSGLTLNLTPANPAALAIDHVWGTNTTFDATTTINVAVGAGNTAGFDTVLAPGFGALSVFGALNNTSGDVMVNGALFHNGGVIDAAAAGTFTVGASTFFNSGTVFVASGEQFSVTSSIVSNSGLLSTDGTILFQNAVTNAGSLGFSGSQGLIILDQPSGFNASISGWVPGDEIELAPGATYTFDPSSTDGNLVIDSNGSKAATFAVGAGYTLSEFAILQGSGDNPSFVVQCFAKGTRIQTEHAEVAVEDLRIGDRVKVLTGPCPREIVWIGHRRVNCADHPAPERVWPVRVAADAFGTGRPHRDLWLSPDHAVHVLDVLIPIKYLINGRSIAQVAVDEVEYYHLELPSHDVLLAEGLAVESWLDSGARSDFVNAGATGALYPDFAARVWEYEGCMPLIISGDKLEVARRWTKTFEQIPRQDHDAMAAAA